MTTRPNKYNLIAAYGKITLSSLIIIEYLVITKADSILDRSLKEIHKFYSKSDLNKLCTDISFYTINH